MVLTRIDISAEWLEDIREGCCSAGFYLNKKVWEIRLTPSSTVAGIKQARMNVRTGYTGAQRQARFSLTISRHISSTYSFP
jgi:hypothetical protein